jgi:hypothetical protein
LAGVLMPRPNMSEKKISLARLFGMDTALHLLSNG